MAVYFIRDENNNVKIGHAIDPWKRLQDLQVASPGTLEIIRIVDGGQKVEAWLHRRFAEYRLRGEWFDFRGEMLSVIPPDELPPPPRRPVERYRSIGDRMRDADRLGLLSEKMRQEWAPFLDRRS